MRTLDYRVIGQRLVPTGDHSGLVACSAGYLKARFMFNDDWDYCSKRVTFVANGAEYPVHLINDECVIPSEVLKHTIFELYVEGRKPNYVIISRSTRERQLAKR